MRSTAYAQLLITEVIPGISTTTTAGDVVELHNAGPAPVDLTGYFLTDLDPGASEISVLAEGTFAPASLGLPPLASGAFAVVVFVDSNSGATPFSFSTTNYGLRIAAPVTTGSFLNSDYEEVLLTDALGTPLDSVAWSIDSGSPSNLTDSLEDLSAITPPASNYGLTLGDGAWSEGDVIADLAAYRAATVDLSGLSGVTTWGGGVLQRASSGGIFDVGSPDGPAQWLAVERHRATLGDATDRVPVTGGFRPIRITDDLGDWLAIIQVTTTPHRRIARFADQTPADFISPDINDRNAWENVINHAMAGEWPEAFADALPLGYEVVEFLDTDYGETFQILRETTVPGQPGFRGQGIYVFYNGPSVREHFMLQVPHPTFDSGTLEQGA